MHLGAKSMGIDQMGDRDTKGNLGTSVQEMEVQNSLVKVAYDA